MGHHQHDDDEIESLRGVIRDVCKNIGGVGAAQRLSETDLPFDRDVWTTLARDVGLSALGLPEELDGLGGVAELAAVADELGRHLVPVPFLTSVVTVGQIVTEAGAGAAAVGERLAAGEVAAFVDFRQVSDPVLRRQGDGLVITGSGHLVPGLPGADLVLLAVGDGGDGLAWVDCAADGVEVTTLESLDVTRRAGRLELRDAVAHPIALTESAGGVVERALDTARIVLAAEQLGAAQAALDMTVEYVKERRQFGRAIGSFQAVKHRCAEMLVQVESARSAVFRALEVEPGDHHGRAEAASVASAWCSDALKFVSSECVHLHGGIGFTWEHPAHLYFRRARSDANLMGSATDHREKLATMLGW